MAASRLGLRAAGLAPMVASPVARLFSSTSQCARDSNIRKQVGRMYQNVTDQPSPRLQSAKQLQSLSQTNSAAVAMLFPGTFVRPPLSKFPRKAGPFFRFTYDAVKSWGMDIVQSLIVNLSSKPSFFKRALWKPKTASAVLSAKALHRSMSEAIAAGDKNTINKICVTKLAVPLLASIDTRPKSVRYSWELVRYNKTWRYPRVLSRKISPITREPGSPFVRQLVVAIASRQRMVKYDDSAKGHGRIIPGSEKEVDLVENVVITCTVDRNTWAQDEWRIFGTLKPTLAEDWEVEKHLLGSLEAEEMSKHKV